MRKILTIAAIVSLLAIVGIYAYHAITSPAREAARNLAAINGITVEETREAELLAREGFQPAQRNCLQSDCFYRIEAKNAFLSRLHLAPDTSISIIVSVRNGLVISVIVFVVQSGLPAFSMQQVQKMPGNCVTSPCISERGTPSGPLRVVNILFNNASGLRNHLPDAVNSKCLSRLHGCGTYTELMPVIKELNLNAINYPVLR